MKKQVLMAAALAFGASGAFAGAFSIVDNPNNPDGDWFIGNDCKGSGAFVGTGGFSSDEPCQYGGSDWIVKYDINDNNEASIDEWNTTFGPQSDFDGITVEKDDTGWFWQYVSDYDGPLVTAFVAKGGNPNPGKPDKEVRVQGRPNQDQGDDTEGNGKGSYFVYAYGGDGAYMGTDKVYFSFPKGSSHVTFFDSVNSNDPDPDPIPLPAAGWLMLAGIGGLVAARRRKA